MTTTIFNEERLDWSDNPVKVWKIIIFKSMFPLWSKRPIKIGLWLPSFPSDLRVANRSTVPIFSLKGFTGPTDINIFVLTISGGSFTRHTRVVWFPPSSLPNCGSLWSHFSCKSGRPSSFLTFGWFWILGPCHNF